MTNGTVNDGLAAMSPARLSANRADLSVEWDEEDRRRHQVGNQPGQCVLCDLAMQGLGVRQRVALGLFCSSLRCRARNSKARSADSSVIFESYR